MFRKVLDIFETVNISEDAVSITGYHGGPEVNVPGMLHGLTVKEIGCEAFSGHREIRSVTLPDIFPEKASPDPGYFLYVGGYDRRKGLDILVQTFLDMKQKGLTECKLVLAGRPRPLDHDTDGLIQTGVEEGSIVQTGYVSDEELCSFLSAPYLL